MIFGIIHVTYEYNASTINVVSIIVQFIRVKLDGDFF